MTSESNWKKVFAVIWTGQLVSILSSSVVGYAIVFWLSIKTGSAEILAIATIAALLPQSVLGLFTGVYIDRWNRKFIMIASDLFIALCTLIIVILFITGSIEIWYIYFLSAARSVGMAFHMPAMQASIPLLAPQSQLMRIAGINQMIHSSSAIAGPVIGALLISIFDMSYVLMFDIFGALVGAGTLMMVAIPSPEKKSDAAPHIIREIKEGLHEIYKNRGLFLLFIFSVIAFFFIMPVAVLFPLMTLNHFGGGVMQMSIVEVLWGAGMLIGGAIVGAKKLEVNKAVLINFMYFIIGLTFLLSGLLPSNGFIIFIILTALGGISAAIYNASFTSLIQIKIDPAVLGRVFSTYNSLTMLPALIGLLGTGFIADNIGIMNAFIICGSVILLVGVVSMFSTSIRETGNT